MELKFELDTRLTVSCVANNSVLLAFGNAVILLLIMFELFGWRELLGEFGKKRSAAK
jgi:hypothetical protein